MTFYINIILCTMSCEKAIFNHKLTFHLSTMSCRKPFLTMIINNLCTMSCYSITADKALFHLKKYGIDMFLISPQKICCGYSLEAP